AGDDGSSSSGWGPTQGSTAVPAQRSHGGSGGREIPDQRSGRMSLRTHILVAGLFVGLVAVFTPIVPSLHGLQRLDAYNVVVMRTVFHNLLTQPRFLLEGPGFYPFGTSLTFMEPLVTPALVMGPLSGLTHDPVVAFNLTLLL